MANQVNPLEAPVVQAGIDPAFGGISADIDPAFGGLPIPEQEEPGFLEKIEGIRSERLTEAGQSLVDLIQGDIGPVQATTQIIGKGVAGQVLDIAGEGLSQVGKGLSFIIPDSIEDPIKESVKEGWDMLTKTDFGKAAGEALKGGIEQYREFKKENPQAAKTIESAVNIAAILAPPKVKANAKPTVLGKTAGKIEKVAGKQIAKRRSSFVGDLVAQRQTAKVRLEEVPRTIEKGIGPTKRSVIKLSPRELEIAGEVSKIKGVSTKNSIQGNYIEVSKANEVLAKKLESDVGKSNLLISVAESSRAVDDAVNVLIAESPVIVGNAATAAKRIAEKAKQFLTENASTPLGVLKARKQLDGWVKSQKGSKIFAPELESTLSVSVRAVRRSMNDIVDSKVKNTAVKEELKRQNLLYEALDNIGPKAADEANTAIGRSLQNMAKVLPFRSKFINEAGAVVGLGIVGASATFAPVFAYALGATAVSAGVYKTVVSPALKKHAAKLIRGIDRAILTSKNPSMIKQLRADRAIIMDVLKNSEVAQEEQQ